MMPVKLALVIVVIYLMPECLVGETTTGFPLSSSTTGFAFSTSTSSEASTSSESGEGSSAYLLCLMHFHQYIKKNRKYIRDLRDRVKCHEDWIKHQDGRIKDLEKINKHLMIENDHLQHVIYILHDHYTHLWHHYKAMRNLNKQCRNKLASC